MMANQATPSPAYQRIGTPSTKHQLLYSTPTQTKIIVIVDFKPPVTLIVPETPGRLTLGQFKHYASFQNGCHKFYFKSQDDEFGTVKEELVEDDAVLPLVGGAVLAWVVSESKDQAAGIFQPSLNNEIDFNMVEHNYQADSRFTSSINRARDEYQLHRSSSSHLNYSPAASPKLLDDHRPVVPPRPPARGSTLTNNKAHTTTESKPGFDPATELPAPLVDPNQIPPFNSDSRLGQPEPIVNFHRANNYHQEHQRASHSLPRSLTPRSLYASGNLDSTKYQIDSRSDYEPTTPTSLRSNLYQIPLHCAKDSMHTIYASLKADAVTLDVRDREWLKVVIKDAFLGAALVKWLSRNVYGFCNKSEVKRYANQMLTLGFISSPISKAAFSEKCLYTLR